MSVCMCMCQQAAQKRLDVVVLVVSLADPLAVLLWLGLLSWSILII